MILLALLGCPKKETSGLADDAARFGEPTGARESGVTCSAKGVSLEITEDNTAIVTRDGETSVYPDLVWTWDGTLMGTARSGELLWGYENHYGCLRSAELVLGEERFAFSDCLGGTTDDGLCYP